MPRIIKSGLIQMSLPKTEGEGTIPEIVDAMVQKHIPYIEEAGRQGVQILCLQEIFNTPYFCPGQNSAWYESAEPVPGPLRIANNRYQTAIDALTEVLLPRQKNVDNDVMDDRAIARLDTGIPHIARVYDYVLGGYFRERAAAYYAQGALRLP